MILRRSAPVWRNCAASASRPARMITAMPTPACPAAATFSDPSRVVSGPKANAGPQARRAGGTVRGVSGSAGEQHADVATTGTEGVDHPSRVHDGAGRVRHVDGAPCRAGRVRGGLFDRWGLFTGERVSRSRLVDPV